MGEGLRELGSFNLEKKRLRVISLCKHLIEKSKDTTEENLVLLSSERTRGNGQELKYKEFHLNLRKTNCFTLSQTGC